MRTKDELFRAAQREVAAYRQQAVMQAETARRAAYAAHPALAEADSAHLRAGLGLAKAAALGGNMDTARAALARADEALAAAVREAGFSADDFKPAYRCPLCEDTGMRGGVPCRCVADAARRLRSLVAPFMLRRLKADVLQDLPDKLESVVYVPMEAEQQRLYDVHGKANILHDPYYNPNLTMDREDFSESDDLRGLKEGRITVQWRE